MRKVQREVIFFAGVHFLTMRSRFLFYVCKEWDFFMFLCYNYHRFLYAELCYRKVRL